MRNGLLMLVLVMGVWNTVFQALLFAGYSYVHWLSGRASEEQKNILHAVWQGAPPRLLPIA